jgi:hypothetical protein
MAIMSMNFKVDVRLKSRVGLLDSHVNGQLYSKSMMKCLERWTWAVAILVGTDRGLIGYEIKSLIKDHQDQIMM